MTKQEMAELQNKIFDECKQTRQDGQQEYAHNDDNAFANFERISERTEISPYKVLLVYLEKHMDGIHSFIKGHKSQREDIRGRIKDAIVYLCLLRGMIETYE